MIKVLLLSDYSREPERLQFRGLTKFANEKGGWSFFSVPAMFRDSNEFVDDICAKVRELKVDAIFGSWRGINEDKARKLNIPVVIRRQNKGMNPHFSYLTGHNEQIAKIGADYFLNTGYSSFAYCGFNGVVWSDERYSAYKDILAEQNFQTESFFLVDRAEDVHRMSKWLSSLPHHTALFCGNDVLAQIAAEACLSAGLSVPDDIAILGVDDDEFICNTSYPPLSSVHIDYEYAGYQVGKAIFEMLSLKKSCGGNPRIIYHNPTCVIERESTIRQTISDKNIARIIEFFETHYTENISLADAIRDIPMSRRCIEVHFRKEFKSLTMLQYLTQLRINHMCKLLAGTNKSIANIADESGLGNNENIYRIFKKYTGMTPDQYRKSHSRD